MALLKPRSLYPVAQAQARTIQAAVSCQQALNCNASSPNWISTIDGDAMLIVTAT